MYRDSAQSGNERRTSEDGSDEQRNEQMSEDERKETKRLYIQPKKGKKYAKKDVRKHEKLS